MSRLALPGLSGKQIDQVLPMVVAKLLPRWVGTVALIAVISALMSADPQFSGIRGCRFSSGLGPPVLS